MIRKILESDIETDILLGGLVASVFLLSKGYELGSDTEEDVNRHAKSSRIIDEASDIMTKFRSRIHLPKDVAVKDNGSRQEFTVSATPFQSRIKDIGSKTNKDFREKVTSSNCVVGIGPLGVAEEDKFSLGTETVYRQISKSQPSAIYGDTTAQICEDLGITGFSHTSRGDEAVCEYLSSNKEPPGISILLPEDSESNEKSVA
jgi:phosphoglycerate kinase